MARPGIAEKPLRQEVDADVDEGDAKRDPSSNAPPLGVRDFLAPF